MTHSKINLTSPPLAKLILISLLIGASSGILCTYFLVSLNWIISIHRTLPNLIYSLPLVGLATPLLFKKLHEYSSRAMTLILEEAHNPNQWLPWRLTPMVYLTTLLSHLAGASAGREGTALQISTGFADQIAKWLRISLAERKWILISALSAGFGTAIGTPMAGMIFGMEVTQKLRTIKSSPYQLIACFIASFSAWAISKVLHAPHFHAPFIMPPEFSSNLLFLILSFSILIGLVSRFYSEGLRQLENLFHRIPVLYRAFLGGTLLLMLYWYFPLSPYHGLGLESIQDAFDKPPSFEVPLLKLLLTLLTLASGFKGGEFVPLVFIGTTMGSVLAAHWQQPLSFFSALGYASLFGATAKTPLTCTLVAIEFFGWEIAPYALLVSFASYATAGPFGIYRGAKPSY